MKNRLYKSQILDGEKKMAEYVKQLKKDFWKHLFQNVMLFLLVILAVIGIALITKQPIITNIICIPLAVRVLLPRFVSNFFELKAAGILGYDRTDFRAWMKLQTSKFIPKEDRERAIAIYKEHKSCKVVNEIKAALDLELEHKPGRQMTICVLCGLLFACDNFYDGEYLFWVKYRHGAAGNMVFEPWVRMLRDSNVYENLTRNDLIQDFYKYWDKICRKK